MYFRDTGLLHYFLGINNLRELDVHPGRGASWEAFVVEEMLSALRTVAPTADAYFWRTAAGDEVDLLLRFGPRLVPIEIKLHSAPTSSDAAGVHRCMKDLGCKHGYVIYPGDENYALGRGVTALSASRLFADPQQVGRL